MLALIIPAQCMFRSLLFYRGYLSLSVVILCLRTMALWEKSRKIILFLVTLAIVSLGKCVMCLRLQTHIRFEQLCDGVIATTIWLEFHAVHCENRAKFDSLYSNRINILVESDKL